MSDELLHVALAHAPGSVSIYALDSTVVFMNPVTEQIMGVRFEEIRGKRLFDLYPDAIGTAFHSAFIIVAVGGPSQTFEHYYPRFDGWYSNHVERVGEHVYVFARDVTTEIRQRRRMDTLALISQLLTTTDHDMRATATGASQIVTDEIEAECTIALLSDDGAWLDVVARTSRDESALALLETMRRWPAHTGNPAEALRTRKTVLVQLSSPAVDPSIREVIDQYAPTSVLVAPLIMGDVPIGVLVVSRRRGSAPLTLDDQALIDAIAPSIALYIAMARRREETTAAQYRLSLIADAIPALVAFVDSNERYQYVNATYAAWFGLTPPDFIGRRPQDILPAAYPIIEPHIRRALAGEHVRFRTRAPYPSGVRDVDAQYVPVRAANGDVEGFAALVQDVTAEVRVVEAERLLSSRLQSFLAITGLLAGASSLDDIARVLVDEGVKGLDAAMGALWTLSPDGNELVLVRQLNYSREHQAAFARMPITVSGPVGDVVSTGKPVIMASRAEYAQRYEAFESAHRPPSSPPLAFAMLPLLIEGRVVGCINIAFREDRAFTAEERTYLELLASHGAEALRRARVVSELRDVSETQAALIQASPAAITLVDEHGTVLLWNAAAEVMLNRRAAEIVGKQLPLEGAAGDDVRAVLAGNVLHGVDRRRVRGDGSVVEVELYAAPVRLTDGRTVCLSIAVDVSERKRVERGRQLIARAASVFNKSLDWHETLRQFVRFPLDGFATWCGVDLLRPDGRLQRVSVGHDDTAPMPTLLDYEPARGGTSQAIATGEPVIVRDMDEQFRNTFARDPEHRRAIVSMANRSALAVPMRVGDQIVGAIAIATRDRNFDDVDVAILSELANHVASAYNNARLYAEAREARHEAEQASQAKDQFLAMLGHELRNPLAPMVTALELMSLRGSTDLAREREVIGRQVDHLSQLVDDLLDVSRITRGKIELRRERLAISDIVAKAIEQASPLFEQRKHQLTVDVPASLIVDGDPLRLAQIVANLLSNAAKYTPENGRINVTAQREDTSVVLLVRDNGIGIAPEMLPRVFDLFVQAPQSSERPAGGLGLGLTIVKSLVEMHGGSIGLHSNGRGTGTEAKLVLPAAEATAAVEPSFARAVAQTTTAKRILIVDDNEDAATLLAEMLQAHGHEMRTAFDGPSALRIADEFHPEIAVLDIGLPVMDGYELAQRLRSTSNVRLIALSGYGQESDRARAREAGFQAHLAKPVPFETLMRLVEQT